MFGSLISAVDPVATLAILGQCDYRAEHEHVKYFKRRELYVYKGQWKRRGRKDRPPQ